MSIILQMTPQDPLVARDGRPFGDGQGSRMRGLPWPLPSVVAGSFRTALVKAGSNDFSGDIPTRLMEIAVAGVFPVCDGELYLPAPNDAVAEPGTDEKGLPTIKTIHRVQPLENFGGCDFPNDLPLKPVMLSDTQSNSDFKPADIPSWWPVEKISDWLVGNQISFDKKFLKTPITSMRDHVALEADQGAAEEGKIFASSNLNVGYLPRFRMKLDDDKSAFRDRFAEVTLSARVTIPDSETKLNLDHNFDIWHPLGGERRMVHWSKNPAPMLWNCPGKVKQSLKNATRVRMVLATPAIFKNGWKPDWLTNGLDGELSGVKLKLVGASNGRWKAISGWSLAPPKIGPKPIRRMVPAGSVYFFEVEKPGAAEPLADLWLQSVSDDKQEGLDGFGLAVWGTW